MTERLIHHTSSTSEESPQSHSTAATSSELNVPAQRAGKLLASLFLWAALTTAGPTGTAPVGPIFKRRDKVATESSTAELEVDVELVKQVEHIFERGATEVFYDGMYSEFSRALIGFFTRYGGAAFPAINAYLSSGCSNADVVSEALRWLAAFDDPVTLPQRWAILQRTLKDRSPRIRDGAILGFAALDDPRARSLLLESQKSESIPELRRLLAQVVDQLNATDAAISSHR
jgi:hypothetical protein